MGWLGDLGSAILGGLYANPFLTAAGGIGLLVVAAVTARRRGWLAAAARHPRRAAAVAALGLAVTLPIGWYLGSPLVLTASIDEPPPFAAVASPSSTPRATPSRVPAQTDAPRATPEPSPSPMPRPFELTGSFQGSDDFHFGRGTARLIEVAPGSYVVRLEDFAVRNGPDLYVYLSPSADGYTRDAIEIGRLKADRGNQNYDVPSGALADPARAASVVIWCKQFSHLFATAPLDD